VCLARSLKEYSLFINGSIRLYIDRFGKLHRWRKIPTPVCGNIIFVVFCIIRVFVYENEM
jgi:hypothetical protein